MLDLEAVMILCPLQRPNVALELSKLVESFIEFLASWLIHGVQIFLRLLFQSNFQRSTSLAYMIVYTIALVNML